MKMFVQTTLYICFLATLFFSCKVKPDQGEIVAEVGDEVLTMTALMQAFPEHIKKDLSSVELREFVLRWIDDQVLYQEAVARGVQDNAEMGKELERLKREVVINKLLETILESDIVVSPEEIAAHYEGNKEAFILSQDAVRANHILVKTNKEANEVRARLRARESFEQVARSVQVDTMALPDWDLGYFTKNDVIPEISKVVFKMKIKAISKSIKSQFGYHVLELVDIQKKGDVKRLETVNEEIKHKLITKKRQDKFQRFLLQMKSKFKIQTNFQLLDSSVIDSLLYSGD